MEPNTPKNTLLANDLTPEQRTEALLILHELERRKQANKYIDLFANDNLYPKHREFMAMGAIYPQRLCMGGNRSAKTTAALCEVTMHVTGEYPDWWQGKRFTQPNNWWIVGPNSKLIKSSLQRDLLGEIGSFGTGLIPNHLLDHKTLKDARSAETPVGKFRIKHTSGGYSTIEFKSAESGREAFQAWRGNILIDEECPFDVYNECLKRTAGPENDPNSCIMMLTFTPLKGATDLINQFYGEMGFVAGPHKVSDYKWATTYNLLTDAPHISESWKQQMWDSTPDWLRPAVFEGIPSLGSGKIYNIPEDKFVIEPFTIPKNWKKFYAMDVGWKRTAALWFAIDPNTDTWYVYSEHYQGESEPSVHAASIKARGDWMKGIIDSAANGSSQINGENLMDLYTNHGLKLINANKAILPGLLKVYDKLSQGRLKVFNNLQYFMSEIRQYKRDDKGRIVKENDHLMDTLRYGVMSDGETAMTEEEANPAPRSYTISPQYKHQPIIRR